MSVLPAVCVCVCVCVESLAGVLSLRVYSVLPGTSGVSMMPCLSLFEHSGGSNEHTEHHFKHFCRGGGGRSNTQHKGRDDDDDDAEH